MLGGVGASALRTDLIICHSITDILGQTTKLIHILSAIQEPRDLASLFQRNEVPENPIQVPTKLCASDQPLTLESVGLPF